MNTQEIAAAAAPAKQKSPMLTSLEKVVYTHCLETGDTIEEAKVAGYSRSPVVTLADRILVEVWDQIRVDRVQEKLELSVAWLKEQLAKERAGVRRPQDEPQGEYAVGIDMGVAPPTDA